MALDRDRKKLPTMYYRDENSMHLMRDADETRVDSEDPMKSADYKEHIPLLRRMLDLMPEKARKKKKPARPNEAGDFGDAPVQEE